MSETKLTLSCYTVVTNGRGNCSPSGSCKMHGCSQGVDNWDKQIVSGRQRSERLQYGAVILTSCSSSMWRHDQAWIMELAEMAVPLSSRVLSPSARITEISHRTKASFHFVAPIFLSINYCTSHQLPSHPLKTNKLKKWGKNTELKQKLTGAVSNTFGARLLNITTEFSPSRIRRPVFRRASIVRKGGADARLTCA